MEILDQERISKILGSTMTSGIRPRFGKKIIANNKKQKLFVVSPISDSEDFLGADGVYSSLELAKTKIVEDFDDEEIEITFVVDGDLVMAFDNGVPIAVISTHILDE